ncbi:histone-lysine N-methyltransferase ATXR6-like isoform X2 [Olea europaea var. sylvestris]|uniref:histone-lysine N-methyltransferase ATXR6-like isoform X2 n=1 Tax=Olea europaea var. sylvestris TaxID=158386 RepID=UPI000C1D0041|nr:histone-lysine N-methyltransferase ATXR6-like isoform X2 [Olea europaea var. sylvestris]
MVSTMALRKRTLAPKPFSEEPKTRKSSRSEEDYSDVCCENCGSGDRASELLLCDKCDLGFHLYCLRPVLVAVPKGSWFCPSCSKDLKPTGFPLVQTKIVDFFRIQRSSPSEEKLSPDSRKRRRRNSGLVMAKKRRKLLPFNPSEDYIRRLEQMATLATALTATETLFVNELTYVPGMAPRSANCSSLEREGMQVLSKEDAETLSQCKNMMERGEWPPLMVVFDPLEGFTVEADKFIRDLTIITEYVGDVDYLKNRENDDGDSMMTLLSASDPSKSLVICPDKRSNIARFINGINNHTLDGKKKQNVKCVRFDVNGEGRVLLIASRDIRKGERLYYDYNGYENEYPTEHFV